MKLAKGLLLLLAVSIGSILAHAQTPQHIVVIVQENRTPDNLFQDPNLIASGADIWNINNPFPCKGVQNGVQVQPAALNACFDPNHNHETKDGKGGWVVAYDLGKMDGACVDSIHYADNCTGPTYPAVTYAQNTLFDGTHHILDPYFQIAETYGFADYMFQTNQGPSFPAHQFLFSGTSAPVSFSTPYYDWFVGENPYPGSDTAIGCVALLSEIAVEIDPSGDPESPGYTPPDSNPPAYNAGYPCYNHPSMADVLDTAGVTWKYYAPPEGAYNIWTAPNALQKICPPAIGGTCNGSEWTNHVVIPTVQNASPILTDIQNCNLPAVSWVIPDGVWSDHAGSKAHDGGPSWVATILNAIGGAAPFNPGCGYWANTVVLITWDDWGGFFDHVLPPDCSASGKCTGYRNGTGTAGQQYVYGFRVPLLVVSAYANQNYISGSCTGIGCPNEQPKYTHDFGSILGYIEHVFAAGEISPQYHYADYYAPDGPNECPPQTCPYPLSDFFGTTYHSFAAINGAKYPPHCFMTDPQSTPCFGSDYPSDPDDDEIDP